MSIEEKITRKICDICYDGESEDEREVVEYGLALLVETTFKFAIMFIFSILVGKVWETISFIIVFCPIRSNAGGIHCRSNWGCTISLFAIYFLGLLLDYIDVSNIIVISAFLICIIVCSVWAPSATENNPITDRKIRALKKIFTLLLLCISLVEYKYTVVGLAKGAILTTYISISVLVVLLELTRKKK